MTNKRLRNKSHFLTNVKHVITINVRRDFHRGSHCVTWLEGDTLLWFGGNGSEAGE